jgi:hypothetical protein
MRPLKIALIAAAAMLATLPVRADSASEPRTFNRDEHGTFGGRSVDYTANVEEFILRNDARVPTLSLFVTSYVRAGVRDPDARPVIFLFNGGPSAASFGVHMQLGPKSPDKTSGFVDNPTSPLDVADLVFVDPAETGFSRVLPGGSRAQFYSTAGDTQSIAWLVQAWLERHNRRASPRYLLGESYGSIRAVVAGDLLAPSMPVDGLILLGESLPLMETSRRTNNIISTAVSLPMLAMTAAYHGKADRHGKTDAAFLDEVYAFAMSDYLVALAKGNTLSEADAKRIAKRLAAYTGISADYYLTHKLAIAKQDFARELLPGRGLDRNDSRKSYALNAAGEASEPAEPNVVADYMRTQLHVELPGIDYRPLAPDAFDSWDWGSGCNDYLKSAGLCNPASDRRSIFVDYDWPAVLERRFREQPDFRVMIIGGYYDMLSSIGTTRFLLARGDYPHARIENHEYAGGHATAADAIAQVAISRDIKTFLAARPARHPEN